MFRKREFQLQQLLYKELYLQLRKYGWVTFQINSKKAINAFWRIDGKAVWHIVFCNSSLELSVPVSQPIIDRINLQKSNTVQIAVEQTIFNFTSKYVFPVYGICDVTCSAILTLTPKLQCFVFSGRRRVRR